VQTKTLSTTVEVGRSAATHVIGTRGTHKPELSVLTFGLLISWCGVEFVSRVFSLRNVPRNPPGEHMSRGPNPSETDPR
jgi:hypothetical protein